MWAKLDDHYHDNPKILSVSKAARWVHTGAISWCCKHLTDGVIPRAQAWRLGSDGEDDRPGEYIRELVDARLFEDLGNGSYQVHDFLDYNPSRDEAEARQLAIQEQRREAGKKRAEGGSRGDRGRFAPAESTPPTSEPPAGHQREDQRATSGPLDPPTSELPASSPASSPAPFPFPFPYSDPDPDPELSGAPSDVDNSGARPRTGPDSFARSRSPGPEGNPRASARDGPEPRASGERPATPDRGGGNGRRTPRSAQGPRPASVQRGTGPPALSEDDGERLDHLRRRILASQALQRHAQAIDRVVLGQLRQGAPISAIEQGLVSLLEHNPRDPAAYLAKVLRVEAPNHHEAAAIAGQRAGMTPEEARKGLARIGAVLASGMRMEGKR